MANRLALPPLYVILDAALLPPDAVALTESLLRAGARLFQYRDKSSSPRELLQAAQALTVTILQRGGSFIVNDRPDIARIAAATGVHLGQDDISIPAARAVAGEESWIGISTHNLGQLERAVDSDADYIAVGPVFETHSKDRLDPVVGLEFVRQARQLTSKPLVAIGGITLERARQVRDAGADSIAVISDILKARDPAARVRQFLEILSAPATPGAD